MSTKLLLSICMIVKDEEKNIRRCIDSLRPLLNDPQVELIVVDTGSSDRTPEICAEYGARVYHHPWSGSFSEMRNISISYAAGQWIFIIDADEEFPNAAEVLNTLRDPKTKGFPTIQLQEKNIISISDDRHVFHVTPRIFSNDGEFRYRGTVHNQPVYKHPVLSTPMMLIHYGYINDDRDLMEKKFLRTSELLKKELEKDPDHVYYRFQLARTYLMHNDYYLGLLEARKSYEALKRANNPQLTRASYYVFGEYARIAFANKQYEEAIQVCEEGLKVDPTYIDLHFYQAFSNFYLGRKQQSVDCFHKYFSIYDTYHRNELDLTTFMAVELYTVDQKSMNIAAFNLAEYYYTEHDYEKAFSYISKVEYTQPKIHLQIKIHLGLKDYSGLQRLYEELKVQGREALFVSLLEQEANSCDRSEIEELSRALARNEDAYGQFNAVRADRENGALIRTFMNQFYFADLPHPLYATVMGYALEAGIPIISALKKMRDADIKTVVKSVIDASDTARSALVDYLLSTTVRPNDFHGNRLHACVGNVLLLTVVERAKREQMPLSEADARIIDHYLNAAIQYVVLLYQTNGIRMMWKTLDHAEHRFYILLFLAGEAWSEGQQRNAVEYYKEAGETYPYFADVVKQLVSRLGP